MIRCYYEKFYFTPGDTRLSSVANQVRQDRRAAFAGTNGIPKPRG